jgi:hypothetical protein
MKCRHRRSNHRVGRSSFAYLGPRQGNRRTAAMFLTSTKEQEMQPGLYTDLPNDTYHKAKGISKSGLDLIHKCPAIYKWRYLDGNWQEPTPAMIVGAATHKMVFEEDKFDSEYAVEPEGINKRTNQGKVEYQNFLTASAGRTILSQTDYTTAKGVALAVSHNEMASVILSTGKAEVSIAHPIEVYGQEALVKVRPDWMTADLLVDLKTTTDASPAAFSKACANFRYHVQAALYLDTVNAHFAAQVYKNFLFIVVEKSPPHQVAIYFADQEMLDIGRREYRGDIDDYNNCMNTNHWPGYGAGNIQPISLPAWVK